MSKWFHRHQWKVRGVTNLVRIHLDYDKFHCPVTEVLLVCDCTDFKTVCIDGRWALEQLQSAPNKKESDAEFFQKLGVKL